MIRNSGGDRPESLSRRAFVRATGASAAGGAALAGAGAAGAQAETYRFGGETQAWLGREPDAVADEENPTLELEAGREYEVVWENLDGAPHNFTIQDADGNVLEQSEQNSEEGATASLTFTARPEMAQYICTIHPSTMVGDLEVSGEFEGGEGEGGGIPTVSLLMIGAVVLAFVSPVLFAFFLFSRGGEREESAPGQRRPR